MKVFRRKTLLAMALSMGMAAPMALAELEVTPPPSSATEKGKDAETDATENALDTIKFKNNDSLHGNLISLSPEKEIKWNSPEAKNEIVFTPDNISSVTFGRVSKGSEKADSTIYLTNGDALRGRLLELNANTLVLDTQFAGKLNIKRSMVKGISPSSSGGAICAGVGVLKNWIVDKNNNSNASIKGGALSIYGPCAIGRKLNLPDKIRIDFDLAFSIDSQLSVLFYAEQPKRSSTTGVFMNLSRGYVYLRIRKRHSSVTLGNSSCNKLRSGKGKITILADKTTRKITLMVNGKAAKTWNVSFFPENSHCFGFLSNGGNAVIKNLSIRKWDGKLPVADKSDDETKKNDSILFTNDDKVSGKLKTIKDGVVIFATEYAELKVPVARVKSITTAKDAWRVARRNAGDARFVFGDGKTLTIGVKSISNGKVEGKSENFGDITCDTSAFEKVEFNIYDEE